MIKGKVDQLIKDYPKNALIGIMDYSQKDYSEIRRIFDGIILNHTDYNLTFSERAEVISLGSVLFAGLEHDDSQFWEVFAEYFNKTVPQIRESIVPYLQHYFSVMRLPIYSKVRNEYVETIKMHAIIPNNKFGEIIQSFYLMYTKDLQYDVSNQAVRELNRFLLELFKANFEEEKIDDDFHGSKMSEIHQLLPMSFKKAYITNQKAVSKVIHGFLRYFDSVYRKEPYKGSLQRRFQMALEDELKLNKKNYEEILKDKKIIRKSSQESQNLDNVFVVPQHFISLEDTTQLNDVWINLYSEDKKIYSTRLSVSVGGFAYRTDSKRIKLKEKINNLKYIITNKGRVLFDSGIKNKETENNNRNPQEPEKQHLKLTKLKEKLDEQTYILVELDEKKQCFFSNMKKGNRYKLLLTNEATFEMTGGEYENQSNKYYQKFIFEFYEGVTIEINGIPIFDIINKVGFSEVLPELISQKEDRISVGALKDTKLELIENTKISWQQYTVKINDTDITHYLEERMIYKKTIADYTHIYFDLSDFLKEDTNLEIALLSGRLSLLNKHYWIINKLIYSIYSEKGWYLNKIGVEWIQIHKQKYDSIHKIEQLKLRKTQLILPYSQQRTLYLNLRRLTINTIIDEHLDLNYLKDSFYKQIPPEMYVDIYKAFFEVYVVKESLEETISKLLPSYKKYDSSIREYLIFMKELFYEDSITKIPDGNFATYVVENFKNERITTLQENIEKKLFLVNSNN